MSVTIAAVNALPYAAEIKELFQSHGRPEFPDFFDRTYPNAIGSGATSWIGRDPAGRLAMHIACFPRRFSLASRGVVAGLMVNLMVDARFRTFFPALALLQRLVRDAKKSGEIDLLYADPNEESRALLRGTHFVTLGTLRRFVLPIRHRRRGADLAVRSLHVLARFAARAPRRATVAPRDAAGFAAQRFAAPAPGSRRFAAHHDRGLYVSRLPGYPSAGDWWLTAQGHGGADGGLLVRGPDASGVAVLHAVRLAPELPLTAVLPGLIAELRRRGCERLQVSTIAESDFGHTLRRCGFVPRNETLPLFALPLTALGEECVRSVKDWEITELECDR